MTPRRIFFWFVMLPITVAVWAQVALSPTLVVQGPTPAACFEARTVGICSAAGLCWSWPKPGCKPPPATAPLLLCSSDCGALPERKPRRVLDAPTRRA